MQNEYSWLQRTILRRFHPRSIFIDSVGFIWFTYFLWNHEWQAAIGVVVIAKIAAYLSAVNIDISLFSKTLLGKIALLHLHPLNLIIQLMGAIVFIYGLWDHLTEAILGGVSLILLGHLFGWSRIDESLRNRRRNRVDAKI